MTDLALTRKEILLVKAIAAGQTKKAAALNAYDTTDPNTASAIASETLRKPKVQEALRKELEKQGITIEAVVKPVAKALVAKTESGEDDIELQLKGHDRAMKLLIDKDEQKGGNTYIFNKGDVVAKKYVKD